MIDKRSEVNRVMRYIGIHIFNHHGQPNYAKAYDKLVAQCRLQWNLNINQRLEEQGKDNLFDVLDGDEIDLVYQSSMKLKDMYGKVMKRAVGA